MSSHIMDLLMSLAAVAALAGVMISLPARGMGRGDPLGRRLRFALGVTMALFAARAALDLGGPGIFATILRISAALVPVAVILVTEGLLRRHAPRWVKTLLIWGTPLAILVALWPSPAGVDAEDLALMLWQVAGFLLAGGLILRRDRESLSPSENRLIAGLSLSLIALAGVAALDFLGPHFGLTLRFGALGVLLWCYLAMHGGRAPWREAAIIGAIPALIWPLGGVDLALVTLVALMVAAILGAALRRDAQGAGADFFSRLAGLSLDDPALRRRIMSHPALQGSLLVTAGDLRDSDQHRLARLAASLPVLRPQHPALDRRSAEEVAHLCRSLGASHLVVLCVNPLTMHAISLPGLAVDTRAEGELWAMARLMQQLPAEER